MARLLRGILAALWALLERPVGQQPRDLEAWMARVLTDLRNQLWALLEDW